MKLSSLLSLACCLGTGALALQPELPFYTHMLRRITIVTTELHDAVNAYNGSDPVPVALASATLYHTLKDAHTALNDVPRLRLVATVLMKRPATRLYEATKALVEDFKAKRDLVIATGTCELVRLNIDGLHAVATNFIGLFGRKMVPVMGKEARRMEKKMFGLMVSLKDHFNEENCPQPGVPASGNSTVPASGNSTVTASGNSTVPSLRGRGVRH